MSKTDADVIVIGAGAVGLACARELAKKGLYVIVIEREFAVGSGISSRNSEVIHSGIYYPTNSLKHLLCVKGRHLLYNYLDSRYINFRKCGKLIVASTYSEDGRLNKLFELAKLNSVENVSLISKTKASLIEPDLTCFSALLCEETGIFDSHSFLLSLHADLEDSGGLIAFGSTVTQIEILDAGGFNLYISGQNPTSITSKYLINCAGLFAQKVARSIHSFPSNKIASQYLSKGVYFSFCGKSPFQRLIYPMPGNGGLGVHATLDLSGRLKFGPDVEWLDVSEPEDIDFSINPGRSTQFYAAIRKYWPGLPDGSLFPDYSGVRPKVSGPGDPNADFRIDTSSFHGVPGLVNLFGIESPGLTASLAIADTVSKIVE